MKKTILKILALCLALLMLAGCGKNTDSPEITAAPETTAAAVESTEATVPEPTLPETVPTEAPDHLIPTPYGDLHFPGDWEPFLKTEIKDGNPYSVTFSAVLDGREEPEKLFVITFGGLTEGAIGAVKNPEGVYVPVKLEQPTFTPDETWSERDINIVFTMQEGLNTVLMNLDMEDVSVLAPAEEVPDETQSSGGDAQPTEPANPTDLAMDTPYMELHYPSKWAEYLSIQVAEGTPYSVRYGCVVGGHAEQHLFTVHFGGDKGFALKTIKALDGTMVEIRIELSELVFDDSWTQEENAIASAMQEDLNYLLGKMG